MSAEDKLNASLRLLDNALNVSPSNVFRWNKGKSLRFSTSGLGLPKTPPVQREKHLKIRKSDILDLSLTVYPDEEISLLDASVTVTEIGQFSTTPVLNTLFEKFQSIYQTCCNTQHVFEAVSNFIELLTNTITSIWSGKSITDKMGNDIRWLLEELNTWRLVFALYKDRTTCRNIDEAMETSGYSRNPSSEKEIVSDLYFNDATVREAQLIVDWLETCYRHENKLKCNPSIAHFTDKTVAWENTICQLNVGSSNFGSNDECSSNEIVSSLDPDCVHREKGKVLHCLDNANDKRLIDQIFEEIRGGQLDRAQQLCIHCGQDWRAAVLEGWRLFHDPNYDNSVQHELAEEIKAERKTGTRRKVLPTEGNPNRDLWKICAWEMCESPLASHQERAIMASLCGHLPSLLKVCHTWEDQIWAYTKVSIDVIVEQYIRQVSLKSYRPLVDSYWNNQRSMEKIIKEVNEQDQPFNANRKLQELIILDNVEELITLCSSWLENFQESSDPHFLRYICHVILILRAVGRPGPAHLADQVICAYVKVLMQSGDCDSVAYYCSLLPEEEQVDLYSTFMERITNGNDRKKCLSAAERYDLHIPLITEKVVQNVRNRKKGGGIEGDLTLLREVTEDDKEEISALEWMVYYPQQRAESMWECNALIRTFLAQGKISSARLAFDRIPRDSIEMILQQYSTVNAETATVDRNALPMKVDATIKEYLCYKGYLDAQEGFSRWFHEFHNTRPTMPKQYEGNDFTEKIAYEHRLKRYNEEYNRWKSNMLHETKTVKALLFNIITFPDEGWLIDEYKEDQVRQDNMERLRRLCIPQIFQLLHKVLHSMQLYDEAIDLASMLMEESTHYYEIFNQTQLCDITMKIGESCDAILKNCLDPFGWEGGDPIDMIDNADDNDEMDDEVGGNTDRMFSSRMHSNIDTSLEEIPGIGDNENIQEEEELITAWAKMAESNTPKHPYSAQTVKESRGDACEFDEDDDDDESL